MRLLPFHLHLHHLQDELQRPHSTAKDEGRHSNWVEGGEVMQGFQTDPDPAVGEALAAEGVAAITGQQKISRTIGSQDSHSLHRGTHTCHQSRRNGHSMQHLYNIEQVMHF